VILIGIFYQFIPFTENNSDAAGELVKCPETCMINEYKPDKEYAILRCSRSGSWRYLIGDTIKSVDQHNFKIVTTGRNEHFLSLCGDHLSVDNMNYRIRFLINERSLVIQEFTTMGERAGSLSAHQRYIKTERNIVTQLVRKRLDEKLKLLIDDYRVESLHALKEIYVTLIPNKNFSNFPKLNGRE
jgi:hypothetical protein